MLIALAVLLLAIAVVLMLAAMRADQFSVSRKISVRATPEKIFPMINDFHRWVDWSPYEKIDADLKRGYAGAASGVGAAYTWEGQKTGQGSMDIVESVPPSRIAIKLEFTKPVRASNIATFELAPKGDSTEVTWSMSGPTPYLFKIVHVFINMDHMVGKDFETGLANLKALAER